jgi:hypothetical protein
MQPSETQELLMETETMSDEIYVSGSTKLDEEFVGSGSVDLVKGTHLIWAK